MNYTNVSPYSVVNKVFRDFGLDDQSWVMDAMEWIGEVLQMLKCIDGSIEDVATLTVTGHRAALPKHFYQLIMICYEGQPLRYSESTFKFDYLHCENCINRSSNATGYIIRHEHRLTGAGADYKSSDGTHLIEVGQTVKLVSPYYVGGDDGHIYKKLTIPTTVNLSTIDYSTSEWLDVTANLSDLSNTLEMIDSPTTTSEQTYKIFPNWINTSFEEGEIDIAYRKISTDDQGLPMVPDNVWVMECISWYIMGRLMLRGNKHPSGLTYIDCKREFQWNKRRARADGMYPSIDKMEAFKNMMMRIAQPMDHYNTFFQHLHRPDGFINT